MLTLNAQKLAAILASGVILLLALSTATSEHSSVHADYENGQENEEEEPTPTPTPTATPTPAPASNTRSNVNDSGDPYICHSTKPEKAPLAWIYSKTQTSTTIVWSSVDGATHYSIVYGYVSGKPLWGVVNTGNVTMFTISHLEPGREYFFQVAAVNSCAPGAYSLWFSTTTEQLCPPVVNQTKGGVKGQEINLGNEQVNGVILPEAAATTSADAS